MKTRRFARAIRSLACCALSPVAAILLFLPASHARAAIVSWTNIAGGNWSVAANWSTGTLPTAGDDVSITSS